MSKAKELAREVGKYIGNTKAGKYQDSVLALLDAVLSEPEPLRGWIEVKGIFGNRVLLHLATGNSLREVGEEDSSCNAIYGRAGNLTCMKEYYDEIKHKIARAG